MKIVLELLYFYFFSFNFKRQEQRGPQCRLNFVTSWLDNGHISYWFISFHLLDFSANKDFEKSEPGHSSEILI